MFENLQNSFNGMFGKVAPGMCRLTMNGNIAVKCGNGYKSYNVPKGILTNVTNFCFNIGDEMYNLSALWFWNLSWSRQLLFSLLYTEPYAIC